MRFCWDCRSWRSRIGTNFTSESRGNVWDFAEWLTLSKTVVMLSLCSSVQFWYRFSVRAKPIVVDTMAEVRTKCPCQQASFTRQAHVLPPYDVHLVPNLLHAFSALLVICLLHLISIIFFFWLFDWNSMSWEAPNAAAFHFAVSYTFSSSTEGSSTEAHWRQVRRTASTVFFYR